MEVAPRTGAWVAMRYWRTCLAGHRSLLAQERGLHNMGNRLNWRRGKCRPSHRSVGCNRVDFSQGLDVRLSLLAQERGSVWQVESA